MSIPKFWEYELTADILCIGERFKKGLIRPCVETIPYSTITGALRQEVLGIPSHQECGHAAGCLDEYEKILLVGGPRDTATGASRLPLTTEALVNVKGRVYIVYDDSTKCLPGELKFQMGALKSKGFGRVTIVRQQDAPICAESRDVGYLDSRIPESLLQMFGIKQEHIKKPVWGYLFKPTSETDGKWVKALYEGSVVEAPSIMLERRNKKT